MQEEDYDEDIYEETTSKVVYKKRSSTSRPKLKEADVEKADTSRVEKYPDDGKYNLESDEQRQDWTERETVYSDKDDTSRAVTGLGRIGRQNAIRSDLTEKAEDDDPKLRAQRVGRSKDISEFKTEGRVRESWSDSDLRASEKVKDEMKDWSERAKQTTLERPRKSVPMKQDLSGTGLSRKKSSDEKSYYAVTKWAVDYTNKNFVRSKCHKPRGLHRYVFGRPYEWEIDYDNNYYLRSKVNPPKGLHRRGQDIKRKRAPDIDILADSTGWEFEYGPEFAQTEGDVPFYPQERIIGRGGYRFYGVRRNNSDTDRKTEEKRHEIKGLNEDELKYGTEFLQDDVPHMVQQRERRIGRGGYRFPDAERNTFDVRPRDVHGVDYRTSRASIETDIGKEEDVIKKGKPFKRTVLKKTFKLVKPPSVEDFTHGTVLSFVPGKGSKLFYQGKSTKPVLEIKKHPSIRNIFKSSKRITSQEKRTTGKRSSFKDSDSDLSGRSVWQGKLESDRQKKKFEKNDEKDFSRKSSYSGATPERSPPRRYSLGEFKGKELQQDRRRSFDDYEREYRKETRYGRPKEEHFYSGRSENTSKRHNFPPEVQNRIEEIRNNISREGSSRRKMKHDRFMGQKASNIQEETDEENEIDWESHQDHPYDYGKSITEGYEKFVNERGSEIWINTQQKYSEFHHKRGD